MAKKRINMFVLDFWYESNVVWGRVRCFEDLVEKLVHQLESSFLCSLRILGPRVPLAGEPLN